MSTKVIEYITVKGSCHYIADFNNSVKSYIAIGYQPFGNLSSIVNNDKNCIVLQPMVKY